MLAPSCIETAFEDALARLLPGSRVETSTTSHSLSVRILDAAGKEIATAEIRRGTAASFEPASYDAPLDGGTVDEDVQVACITGVEVEKRFRHQGVGRALLARLIAFAHEWRVPAIYLCALSTDSTKEGDPADFYAGAGFEDHGEARNGGMLMRLGL
jgi:GNAT superfamily N-acetyltransferase